MNQIVKAETAPTMSQATTSASVFIALVVILAGLGMAAALQVGLGRFRCSRCRRRSDCSDRLPRAPLDRSHARLRHCGAREFRAPLPCQRGTTEVPRFFFT